MLSLQVLLAVIAVLVVSATEAAKVVCFYDGNSYHREGVAKTNNLTEAALLCDQLIYGHYKVNSDYGIETSFKYPYGKGKNAASEMKLINPNLKVLLSVGGHVLNRKADRALKLLESPTKRTTFVTSVHKTLVDYKYDGVDLGWQWPENFKEQDKQFMDNGFFSNIKDLYGSLRKKFQESPEVYREGFHALIRELKAVLKPDHKTLSLSALPHVNITTYFDLFNLKELADQFVLHTYDYRAPSWFPTLADYSAPLHFKNASNRHPEYNVEATVAQWISAGVPSEKLIVAIPTFGRAWKVDESIKEMTKHHAEPPFRAHDIAGKGTYTQIKGLRAYYEICPHVVNYSPDGPQATSATAGTTLLNRVADPDKRLGTYCFRAPGPEDGIWISYEEPETAAVKASYIKMRKLGGVAVVDLSLDDFQGMCNGVPYPILKAIRQNVV